MENIKFGDKYSYLDYGLILIKKTIGVPEKKSQIVDIPGSHGQINLVNYMGEPKYSNRALKFEFETIMRQDDFMELFSRIENDLQGKELNVILDIDKEFYYVGEIKVNSWESDKVIGKIVIDVDAQPFKYKHNKTIYSAMINGRVVIDLMNLRQWSIPTFNFSNKVNLTFENETYSNLEGEINGDDYDIIFKEGINRVIVDAKDATLITISYQEGGL